MYDYLTERFWLAQFLHAPVYVREMPGFWGAKRMEARIANDQLRVWITDAVYEIPDRPEKTVRALSGWTLKHRTAFRDLNWCIQIVDARGNELVRQQSPDTEYESLIECLKQALDYALIEMEPA